MSAGAAGSLGLMLRAGQPFRILLLLFAIWVLAPFIAVAAASVISKRWSLPTRVALYSAMLVVALCSLAVYGDVAFGHFREDRLCIPCCSLGVMAAYGTCCPDSRANICQGVPAI